MLQIMFNAPDPRDGVTPINVAAALISGDEFTVEQLEGIARHLMVHVDSVYAEREERKRQIGYCSDRSSY